MPMHVQMDNGEVLFAYDALGNMWNKRIGDNRRGGRHWWSSKKIIGGNYIDYTATQVNGIINITTYYPLNQYKESNYE